MRLSRRDRAALVLALECVRRDIWHADHEDAFAALRAGDARAYGLAHDAWTAWGRMFRREACADHRDIMREKQRTWRLLRARLALALRVLLRADAGDYGWPGYGACDGFEIHECDDCGVRWEAYFAPTYHHGLARLAQYDEMRAHEEQHGHSVAKTRRVRPLWESAPPHDGTTPAMRRQR